MIRGCLTVVMCLTGAFLVLAGGGIAAWGIYGYRLQGATLDWPTADGTVTAPFVWREANAVERLFVGDMVPHVEYEYRVDGGIYTEGLLSFQRVTQEGYPDLHDRYDVGMTVPVYYDPDDPSQAVLIPGRDSVPTIIVLIGLVIASVGFATTLIAVRLMRRMWFKSESKDKPSPFDRMDKSPLQRAPESASDDRPVSAPTATRFDLATVMTRLSDWLPRIKFLLIALVPISALIFFTFPLLISLIVPLFILTGGAYSLARLAQRLEDVGEDERAWSAERRAFANSAHLQYTRTLLVSSSQRMLKSLENFTLFAELRKARPFAEQDTTKQLEKGITQFISLIGLNPMMNLMHGLRSGYKTVVFDYRFADRTKTDTFATNKVTPILLQSDRFRLPHFALAGPDAEVTRRFMSVNGMREARFADESGRESKFRLYASDAEAVEEFFTYRRIRHFRERSETLAACVVEGSEDRLLIYRLGRRLTCDELEVFIPIAVNLADMLVGD